MMSHPRGLLGEGQKSARGRKIESCPITLKIYMDIRNHTTNPNIMVLKSQNEPKPFYKKP